MFSFSLFYVIYIYFDIEAVVLILIILKLQRSL